MVKYYKQSAYIFYAVYDNCAITVRTFSSSPSISFEFSETFDSYKAFNQKLKEPFQQSNEAEYKEAYSKVLDLITNPEKFGKDG